MNRRVVIGMWSAVCAWSLSGEGWAANAQQPAEESSQSTDWPTAIARLKQEVFQRPGSAPTRQQLAIAYNNYGVSLGNAGQWDSAIQQLQEALRIDSTNHQFQTNLANIYVNQAKAAYDHYQLNQAKLLTEHAIEMNPQLVEAYILLGEVEYAGQHLKEAKAAWQHALSLDPHRSDLTKRLEQVSEELPVESKFERLSQAYFDLRYEEQLERPAGFDVRDALLEARRLVGTDLGYWPKHKLVVLLYSDKSFRSLRQETPDWVAGQFDGKIRVPLPTGQLAPTTVRQILFHEYTHALIHDLTNNACPTWLNEGLAEYEGRTQESTPLSLLSQAWHNNQLIAVTDLSTHFSIALPGEQVALAYQESYAIVRYLVERYGFWKIRRILKTIGEGQAWETAFTTELRLKLPRLETTWREWLPTIVTAP